MPFSGRYFVYSPHKCWRSLKFLHDINTACIDSCLQQIIKAGLATTQTDQFTKLKVSEREARKAQWT